MDEAARELVRDLQAAQVLSTPEDSLLDMAIYHCQQAAEKAVKAWLQSQHDPFSKTHDIRDLVKQASVINPDFKKFALAAAILTPYVSAFRYPGGFEEPMPSREEFDAALEYAQAIYDFVLNLLPNEARP